jgi:hypothetical protein
MESILENYDVEEEIKDKVRLALHATYKTYPERDIIRDAPSDSTAGVGSRRRGSVMTPTGVGAETYDPTVTAGGAWAHRRTESILVGAEDATATSGRPPRAPRLESAASRPAIGTEFSLDMRGDTIAESRRVSSGIGGTAASKYEANTGAQYPTRAHIGRRAATDLMASAIDFTAGDTASRPTVLTSGAGVDLATSPIAGSVAVDTPTPQHHGKDPAARPLIKTPTRSPQGAPGSAPSEATARTVIQKFCSWISLHGWR